ncbi:MAG: succinylglutamate desuccinylase/aspartoacylase family protein [Helicobacteraceae bacterium]|jgi:hypothetical protein|nr:succinylglutamate desuccinylase/aspartoacylase family protein [Helicobacteraceae bacterium]
MRWLAAWLLACVCCLWARDLWNEAQQKAHATGEFLRFNIYKHEGNESGNTLLIVGGVHGDEPGGYFAPSLLATRYKIKKGALWVVPNLNFESIVQSRRGIFGDMNRKFAKVEKDDPDYASVEMIKAIVLDPRVTLVMNLHDGHGFYRERWESTIFNPRAWGQTLVIDQKTLDDVPFGNMDELASRVTDNLNSYLKSDLHFFSVKNTNTRYKDEEMQRSLTYFAVTHLKPAFGQETSKNIDALALKVEYHLRSIEEIMRHMEIEFERDFELSFEGIQKALSQYGKVRVNDKIAFDLVNLRSVLRYVPLNKTGGDTFVFDHPLGAAKPNGNRIDLFIGNKRLSSLYPQLFDGDCALSSAVFTADGKRRELEMGQTFAFSDRFSIAPIEGIRVNVIGFVKEGVEDEADQNVSVADLTRSFSQDVRGRIYRVEFYKGESFCGMLNARIK